MTTTIHPAMALCLALLRAKGHTTPDVPMSASPPRHTNGREVDCRFGWKYGRKGKTRNRKHVCGPECSWTGHECHEWLASHPYHVVGAETVQPRLVPAAPCSKCDRARRDHWRAKSDSAGLFLGFAQIEECDYVAES